MRLRSALHQFIEDYIWQHGYSKSTEDNYKWAVNSFIKAVGNKEIFKINQEDIKAWRKSMDSQQVSVSSVNAFLYKFRLLLEYYAKSQKLSINPKEIIIPKKPSTIPKVITREQIQELIERAPLREKVIISLLYSNGIRVGELVKLRKTDISGDIMKIRGKGNRERIAYIDVRSKALLETYLALRTDTCPFLLYSRKVKGLGTSRVQQLIKQLGQELGIQVTPHVLRHSFATHMVQAGCGTFHLKEMLGHAHISTTQIYVHLNDLDIRQAYKSFHSIVKEALVPSEHGR